MPRILGVAALFVTIGLGRPALATTVLDLPLPAMSARATVVVRATVTGSDASWYAGKQAIVTRVRLRIAEVLKGPDSLTAGARIELLQTGGVVNGVGQAVPGAGTFEDGEDVLVFLEPAPRDAGAWVLTAMAASKFHILRKPTGDEWAVRDLSDLQLVRRTSAGRLEPVRTSPDVELPLPSLRALVRRAKSGASP